MAMTVKRRQDVITKRVLMSKVADIRGGCSIMTSELGGGIVREGAIISRSENGLSHVVKFAEVVEEVKRKKTIKVSSSNFKVGDVIFLDGGESATEETPNTGADGGEESATEETPNTGADGGEESATEETPKSSEKGKTKAIIIEEIKRVRGSEVETLTLSQAVSLEVGDFILEAKDEDTQELKYQPLGMVGTSKGFSVGDNVDTDIWVIGVAKIKLPNVIKKELNGIVSY